MGVKIYVSNDTEQAAAITALETLGDTFDSYIEHNPNTIGDQTREQVLAFLQQVDVVVGAAQLDTALMGEIGKAYKEKYNEAKATGDDKNENKMLGAMFAVKRIMEMVQPPKI